MTSVSSSSSSSSSIWSFMSRHRKKLASLGILSVASVGGYLYVKRLYVDGISQVRTQLQEFQSQMQDQSRREAEVGRLREECCETIYTFLPSLRKQVFKLAHHKKISSALKEARKQRESLPVDDVEGRRRASLEMEPMWEELKIKCLSLLMSSTYALVLMDLMLRTHLHVVARHAYEEMVEMNQRFATPESGNHPTAQALETEPSPSTNETPNRETASSSSYVPEKITQNVREQLMLECTEYFLGEGLRKLVRRIEGCITQETKHWKMTARQTISRRDIVETIHAIRMSIEHGSDVAATEENLQRSEREEAPTHSADPPDANGRMCDAKTIRISPTSFQWFLCCLVQPDEDPQTIKGSETDSLKSRSESQAFREVLNETMDLFESPHFVAMLEDALEKCFSILLQDLYSRKYEVVGKRTISARHRLSPEGQTANGAGSISNAEQLSTSTVHDNSEGQEELEEQEEVFNLAKAVASMRLEGEAILDNNHNSSSAENSASHNTLEPSEARFNSNNSPRTNSSSVQHREESRPPSTRHTSPQLDSGNNNKYVQKISDLESLDEFMKLIFELGNNPSASGDNLGLGGLSLGQDDLELFSSLLGGGLDAGQSGGLDAGNMNELMQMLGGSNTGRETDGASDILNMMQQLQTQTPIDEPSSSQPGIQRSNVVDSGPTIEMLDSSAP